jgi:hypothetical protein
MIVHVFGRFWRRVSRPGAVSVARRASGTNRRAIQTSIGTGYDLANSIFSPDGRNFQVEYAVKAVENGGTSIGIRCKDGVVLAVEKVITSKLLKPGANKRIATIDRHVGAVSHVTRNWRMVVQQAGAAGGR